jgi:hypothetical protein
MKKLTEKEEKALIAASFKILNEDVFNTQKVNEETLERIGPEDSEESSEKKTKRLRPNVLKTIGQSLEKEASDVLPRLLLTPLQTTLKGIYGSALARSKFANYAKGIGAQ